MMRKVDWRRVIAGGCLAFGAYLLFLVVLAPATLLDAGLRRATDGKLRVAQAQGTLWSGSGVLEIRDAAGKAGVGKALSWAWQPRELLHGQLGFMVGLGHAPRRFPIHLSAHGIELSDADFSLPASVLGVAVPRLAPLGLRGELAFHVAKFASAGGDVTAKAVVTWEDAGSALTPVAPLGTYELRLDGTAGLLDATLDTRRGPLRLDGRGSSRGGGPLEFSATARVDAQQRSQLVPLLRLIAIERGNGEFDLQFSPPLDSVSAAGRPGEH